MSRAQNQVRKLSRDLIQIYQCNRKVVGAEIVAMYAVASGLGHDSPWMQRLADGIKWGSELSVFVTLTMMLMKYKSYYMLELSLAKGVPGDRRNALEERRFNNVFTLWQDVWLNPVEQHQFSFAVIGLMINMLLQLVLSGLDDNVRSQHAGLAVTQAFMPVIFCQLLNMVCSKAVRQVAKEQANSDHLAVSMQSM